MTDRDTHAELQSELRDREEMAKRQAALSDRQPKQRWPYWPETICISAGLLCGILAWVANAKAAEYEIWAERSSGALLRADEPNAHRIRDKDEEPFESRLDCENAIPAVWVDVRLRFQSGWRLKCWPVDVPLPRVVVR
jgi:hypothetical protein